MGSQTKTKTTMLEYIKGLKSVLWDNEPVVSDLEEIDNWGDFHGENQEEIGDMAKILKAETSLAMAKQKMHQFVKARESLENQKNNPQMRQTNKQFKKVENEEELEEQKIR